MEGLPYAFHANFKGISPINSNKPVLFRAFLYYKYMHVHLLAQNKQVRLLQSVKDLS